MRSLLVTAALLAATPALAESPRTILVLDGSGSMWGQIEGEPKIVLARRAVADLLATLPDDMELGLTAYGHRVKGDCADIETLVPVGAATKAQVQAAVDAIKPKGKTPLSDAVRAAAEALKYGEEAATVILVSDGKETCDADPCAVGRALEETGVAFTAHVIGFDVSAEEDRAQLQCLAENTGGTFLSASDAGELSAALQQVAVAPPPPPEPTTFGVTFRAVEPDGSPAEDDLIWTVTDPADGATALDHEADSAPSVTLTPGGYVVEVLRTSDEAFGGQAFRAGPGWPTEVVVTLEVPLPSATLDAAEAIPAAEPFQTAWTGPDGAGDYVSIAAPGAGPNEYVRYAYTRHGSPATITAPTEPGTYELRYVLGQPRAVLATRTVTVEAAQATLDAAETIGAAVPFQLAWTGPDGPNDYVAIAKADARPGQYETYAYARHGSPATMTAPSAPGTYELRYVAASDGVVLATRPVTVEAAQATLDAAEAIPAAAPFDLAWTGPDGPGDYVVIARPDQPPSQYERYSYTRHGSPVSIVAPSEPGTYELRYVTGADKAVLATRSVTVEASVPTLDAAETIPAAATFEVAWTGPQGKNDFLAIAKADAPPNQYERYAYTRAGSPASMIAPSAPGAYELRYVTGSDKAVLATRPITVEAAETTLDAAETAGIATAIEVVWTGPDGPNDYLAIAAPAQKPIQYDNYDYTRGGSPGTLIAPSTPGTYELRYITGSDKAVLAARTITVEDVPVTLDAGKATAGGTVQVAWTGPGGPKDYVAIAKAGAPDNTYERYGFTRGGTPLTIKVPEAPGAYELRYYTGDRTILARQPLTVE